MEGVETLPNYIVNHRIMVNEVEKNFSFTLDNYMARKRSNEHVVLSDIPDWRDNIVEWKLILRMGDYNDELYIEKLGGTDAAKLGIDVSILLNKEQRYMVKKKYFDFPAGSKQKLIGFIPCTEDELYDDELNILCTLYLRWKDTILRLSGSNKSVLTKHIAETKKNDDSTLLESKLFTDCKIICKDKTFDCHRGILCSRSEVFFGMFNCNGMKEADTRTVEINDISGDVLEEMLFYIYTGDVETQKPEELIKAAHKYMLQELTEWCAMRMCENIDTTTAAEFYVLADSYGSRILSETAINQILNNWDVVNKTDGWKTLAASKPNLVTDLLSESMKRRSRLLEVEDSDCDGSDYTD